jgi:hypothetical protein
MRIAAHLALNFPFSIIMLQIIQEEDCTSIKNRGKRKLDRRNPTNKKKNLKKNSNIDTYVYENIWDSLSNKYRRRRIYLKNKVNTNT